jgi:enediyne biosynthesis protein E4
MVKFSRRELLRMLGSVFPAAGLHSALGSSLAQTAAAAAAGPDLFEKLTPETTGIHWSHSNGRSAEYYLPETTGAGCAFLDYDNDGWMDIYLVNSGKCDFFDPQPPLRNALYKNNRDSTFTDVTEKAGVGAGGYGMGVAVGDYDNDGFSDLFVSQYGRGILYHNNGDGTFSDVTEKSGLLTMGWGSSCVWFDYDNDGKLDLFVCRFVDFDKSKNQFCGDAVTGERYYCYPKIYPPAKSWLFHNNGDGTFRDVSEESGIARVLGKAWGVVATDVNNDGWMDLYVANDTVQNFLFINDKGKFEESALNADVAFSVDGRPRSGMGVDAGDYDNDGFEDLFVTNVDQEMYSLYHNNGDGTFEDVASRYGISRTTRLMSGWGVKFFDYDNDGNVDLIIADGHPDDKIENHSAHVTYREPMLLYHNNGKGFENVSALAGSAFAEPMAARGLAVGDFNNDGAVDVLVAVNNGAPALLKNRAANGNHWLGIKLVGKNCNRDAVGARLKWRSGDFERSVLKNGGGSYLASHDPRVVLGIGAREKIDRLEITWPMPSGKVEVFTDLPIDQYVTIVEGKGQSQPG